MTNNKNYSVEKQREVVARAQEALAMKPRDEKESWKQNDAIKAYLEQYQRLARYSANICARGHLRHKDSELIEHFEGALFDGLTEIDLAKCTSPSNYISWIFRKARNTALAEFGSQVTLSSNNYWKLIKLWQFETAFFCEHGIHPNHDELMEYASKIHISKEQTDSIPRNRKLSIRLYGMLKAVDNAREYNPDLDENIFASMGDNPSKIAEDEEAGIAKTAFEEKLDEREKAIVAFRIGEYGWLPEKYRSEMSRERFDGLLEKMGGKLEGRITFVDIGEVIGVTKQRIEQIEKRAFGKIKRFMTEKNGK